MGALGPLRLEEVGWSYSAVVVVSVGVGSPSSADDGDGQRAKSGEASSALRRRIISLQILLAGEGLLWLLVLWYWKVDRVVG